MHNFKYFFREGAGNMLSHGFMSFAAVGVTVACLLIMGTFSLVAYNANINLQDLQKENAVVAFVDESLTDEEAQGLQSQLSGISGVPVPAGGDSRRGGLHLRLPAGGPGRICGPV